MGSKQRKAHRAGRKAAPRRTRQIRWEVIDAEEADQTPQEDGGPPWLTMAEMARRRKTCPATLRTELLRRIDIGEIRLHRQRVERTSGIDGRTHHPFAYRIELLE